MVGQCETLIVSEQVAFTPHNWTEITGGGFASRHDSDGDILYGMEVCVNPEFRRLRIGQRFYRKRQKLCQDRSEEHTSELQSLMRISYAVFCLKKTNKKTTK